MIFIFTAVMIVFIGGLVLPELLNELRELYKD